MGFGAIPSQLATLSLLKILNLKLNSLEGEIPSELGGRVSCAIINITAAEAVYREFKIYGKIMQQSYLCFVGSVGPFFIKIWTPGGPAGI